MQHALSTTLHHRRRKICPSQQKHSQKCFKYYTYNLSWRRLAAGKIFAYKHRRHISFCQPPNIRTLVGTFQEQIAMGDVIDIIGIFPSSEYRRVYFSRGNTSRSRLFLCQILQFLLRRDEGIHFFIFAIIVARSNLMEEDFLLGAGYTFCFVITSFFVKVSIHGIIDNS